MGAEILAPLAKWGALLLGVGGLLYFVYRRLLSGAVAKDDLKEATEAERLAEKARLAHEREDAKNRTL